MSPRPACSGRLSLLDLSRGSAIDRAARRRAQAIAVLVTPCCGPAEEGLSRELSCVLAASYLGLVAVQLWRAAANGNHEHPRGLAHQIAPAAPWFRSEAFDCSIVAYFSLSLCLSSAFHPPPLPRFVVLMNNVHTVESLVRSRIELAAFITPTERLPAPCSAWGLSCHLLVLRDHGRWGRSCSWRQTWARKARALPGLLNKLKIALKWGHQPLCTHRLSTNYACQRVCCMAA